CSPPTSGAVVALPPPEQPPLQWPPESACVRSSVVPGRNPPARAPQCFIARCPSVLYRKITSGGTVRSVAWNFFPPSLFSALKLRNRGRVPCPIPQLG